MEAWGEPEPARISDPDRHLPESEDRTEDSRDSDWRLWWDQWKQHSSALSYKIITNVSVELNMLSEYWHTRKFDIIVPQEANMFRITAYWKITMIFDPVLRPLNYSFILSFQQRFQGLCVSVVRSVSVLFLTPVLCRQLSNKEFTSNRMSFWCLFNDLLADTVQSVFL